MSFYSLHIRNYLGSDDQDADWNPGDSDPDVANKIADAVKSASLAASGDERDELDGRLDYIQEAEMSMDWDEGRRVWWKLSPRLAQPGRNVSSNLTSGGNGSTGNLTVAARRHRGENLLMSKTLASASPHNSWSREVVDYIARCNNSSPAVKPSISRLSLQLPMSVKRCVMVVQCRGIPSR